jgi:SAM-dependent methyltransferase
MDLGFCGEVVDFYHRYRRGYPAAAIDSLMDAFTLTGDDIVVDLGCGTGQLALPIAHRVHAVAGVDPEPDMLVRARRAAAERDIGNVTWMLGADTNMPALSALLGERRVGAVTIGQALHWMDYDQLFPALMPLLRPGGGVAVITNGTPLWLQDSAWSHALRGFLEQSSGRRLTNACGTDEASQRRYRDSLTAAGFDVRDASIEYTDDLDFEHLVGGLYSAFPASQLPPADQRPAFAEQVRRVLEPHVPYTDCVRVAMLFGRNA